MLATAARQAAVDDGKQVVTAYSPRQEKYPARIANNPLHPITADHGGLHLAEIDGQSTVDHTSGYPQHEPETQRRGIGHMKQLIFAILMVILLVIVGSCVWWYHQYSALGKRTPLDHDLTATSTLPSASANPSSSTMAGESASASASASVSANAARSRPSSPRSTSIRKAYNGTSLATLSFPQSEEQNYLLVYQQANGDIRKVVYKESRWHGSTHVTDDARLGTGLAAAWWFDDPHEMIWLYYIDKADRLQALQGHHASDNWTQGSLRSFGFEASAEFSDLSMEFVGGCDSGINAWLCYQTSDGTVRQVWWNRATDSWRAGPDFPHIMPGSQFVTYNRNDIWRVFMMDRESQLVHYYCDTGCKDVEWNQGIPYTFPQNISSQGGIGAIEIGYPILHYQSGDGTLRLLHGSDDIRNLPIESLPRSWGKAMLGTKMAVADGSMFGQPIKLVYQINGSDITATTCDQSSPARNTTLQLELGD